MKTKIFLLFILSLLYSNLFSNGIGIINGAKGTYLKVVETKTSIVVQNQIAIITCTEIFKNTSGKDVKFKYAFPLNAYANPTSIRWKYGTKWKTAEVNSEVQNDSIPTGNGGGDIKPELKEYLGGFPVFFTPKDTVLNDSIIIMEFTYVQLLPYYLGKVSVFQKNNIAALQNDIVEKQSLDFILKTDREVLSLELMGLDFTTDKIGNENTLNFIRHEEIGDYDYFIEYELASDSLGINALSTFIPDSLFSCDTFGNGYFSFIIEPESNANTEVIEKNFILIIDRSGSMSGDKIIQAKDAATYIVQNLNFGDYFNIVDFSSSVRSFSDEIVEYNLDNKNKALSYIDKIYAGGSTNISGALSLAISQFDIVQEDKANIIIFLTDGRATSGTTSTEGILRLVKNQINTTETEIFLFTLGIGQDVDKALLTLLARQNNGLVQFIDPATLEEELVKFFLSVNNPVLLNTEIIVTPPIINEIYPFPFPNLYKGQQTIISGRYKKAGDIQITLKGKAFNLPVQYEYQLSLSDSSDINLSFLPKIWAKQKIDALSEEFVLAKTQKDKNVISDLIDSLSVCYGVVALDFSSFNDGTTTEVNDIAYYNDNIKVYPVPCNDHINLQIEDIDEIGIAYVQIMNAQSTPVYQSIVPYDNRTITIRQLQSLPTGIYYILLKIEDKQFLIKFIKA